MIDLSKREVFRIPYGYIEEEMFDSQKNILEDYLNEKDKIDAEQDKKIQEEIDRSTGEDIDFKKSLLNEIKRSKTVDEYTFKKLKDLFDSLDEKADWDNKKFYYKK